MQALPGVEECAIINTCNRTELYATGREPSTSAIIEWIHDWHGQAPGQFREYFYILERTAAIIHLFKVTSGMDSMVLGEPQITGQVKQAWQQAREKSTLGSVLNRLFQNAFATSKLVRSETGIGHNPVTLPFAALRLSQQIFGETGNLRVLMVGAGEIIEDCARHFSGQDMASLTIANRDRQRAERLAAKFGAAALALDELSGVLHDFDMIVACTASPEPILLAEMFERAVTRRRHKPMFVVDLAVPRNVQSEAGRFEDVYLYTIDDLRAIVESGQRERMAALKQANYIVDAQAESFQRWLNLNATNQTLKQIRHRASLERDRLLEQARAELSAGRDPEEVIKRLSHRLANRLLHVPSTRLRLAGENMDEELLEAARDLLLGDGS